jgi:hypothetical protein
VDADDVHRTVARVERGAVAGVDGAAIVYGAAAWGDTDPEPQAVARVRKPAFCLPLASMASSKGMLEVRCSYVHYRETHVWLTSDGGETNEMLLFHGTGARNPQARA